MEKLVLTSLPEAAMSERAESGVTSSNRHREEMPPEVLLTPSGRGKFYWGGLLFILLTVATFWYQFRLIQAGHDVPRLDQLRWGYLVLILCFLPVEPLILGLRTWIVCRVLQPGIDYWTFFKADLVNTGVALFTPAQIGGGPGQIYILNQSGVQLGTALTITLLGFVGTMMALLGFGLFSLLVSDIPRTSVLFTGAAVFLTVISGLMVVFAIWPGLFRAVVAFVSRSVWKFRGQKFLLHDWWPPEDSQTGSPVDRMDSFSGKLSDLFYTYQSNLRRYLRHGKWSFVLVCFLSLAFFLSRCLMAYFCVRFLGLQGSTLGEIFEIQIALIFLIYLAPTPGNAGIAEGASLWIMQNIVPLGYAPYYNLLWRVTTAYVTATAGLIVLLHRIVADVRNTGRGPRAAGKFWEDKH